MEENDSQRPVIAKPVASRPSCANFMSLSELLSGAISASNPSSFTETPVPIRPKIVRFKPSANRVSVPAVQSQGEESGAPVLTSSDRVLKPQSRPTVVYKPLAKLVSRATASLLANLGNFEMCHQQAVRQVQDQAQALNHPKNHFQTQLIPSHLHRKSPLGPETNLPIDPLKLVSQNPEQNQRSLLLASSGDRPSYDGYNWRKYGQKQVKGSEYPQSYYKCRHPNCPMKKKVERSLEGKITEIVYKGEHNHLKLDPPNRLASGVQGQTSVTEGPGRDNSHPLWNNPLIERNEGSEGKMKNHNEIFLSGNPTYQGKAIFNPNPIAKVHNSGVVRPENSCGLSGDFVEGSRGKDGDDEEPNRKQRKIDDKAKEEDSLAQEVWEPRIRVQTTTKSKIVGDGFRWRKYGQKIVKGNLYPRSYYRCTSLRCNVRKHVERASDDPRAFITTYEGKHNHDMPIARSSNPDTSDLDLQPPDKAKR